MRTVRQSIPINTNTNDAQAYRDLMLQASVAKPPPPKAFSKLPIGPRTGIELAPNEQIAIDGSDPYLRSLSPFVMQLELPLVFGLDGGFVNQSKNSVGINNFDLANRQYDRFAHARDSVMQSGISGSAVEFVGDSNAGVDRLGPPAIADQNTAMDVAIQIENILKTPPLVLLINPNQLSLTLTKVQSYQDRTRYGYIYHAWGEEQPKLSARVKCGAFMAGGKGVQWASKLDSAAWQNLVSLFWLYKNNGYIFDTIGKSYAHHFVGALSISYDNWIYYGHMDSFGWDIDESKMHGGVEVGIEFTVTQMVDTASPSYAVLPMTSPNPSFNDLRYMRTRTTSGVQVTSIGDPKEMFLGTKSNAGSGGFIFDSNKSGRSINQKGKK